MITRARTIGLLHGLSAHAGSDDPQLEEITGVAAIHGARQRLLDGRRWRLVAPHFATTNFVCHVSTVPGTIIVLEFLYHDYQW